MNNSGTKPQSAVIFIGNSMLIRASAVNDSNRGLLTNTLRRQDKKWGHITVEGEGFLRVEDKRRWVVCPGA